MNITPRTWIAAAVVATATALSPQAHADVTNEVRAVTFDDSDGITRVRVRGAQTPTFTVYKLERPTRVVIDMPQARLADALRGHENSAAFTPTTWAVSTIAAQQLDDNAVRVIVTMARPGRYDVKTEGSEVVVTVMPRDPLPADRKLNTDDLARIRAESDRMKKLAADAESARQDARREADSAQATLKQTRAEAETAKAEAERLRKSAADHAQKAEAAQRAVEQAKLLRQQNAATAVDLERAKQTAARMQQEAAASKAAAAAAQREADRTRQAADQARRDALAEADLAKRQAATAQVALQKAQADAAVKTAEADRAKAEASKQITEAERSLAKGRAETEAAKRDAAAAISAAEAARKEAVQVKLDASQAKARAEAVQAAAVADKRRAELTMAQAKRQLELLDKKSAQIQQEETKARAASAAAQAREEAARVVERKALEERAAAEQAAQDAKGVRDRAAASDRSKAAAEATAAEQRLIAARHATEKAQAERVAAEKALRDAKRDLETTRTTLVGLNQQRAQTAAVAPPPASALSAGGKPADASASARGEAQVARTAKPVAKVQAVRFRGDDGNGQIEIAVGDNASVQIGQTSSTRVELIVDNADLGPKLERTLDVSKFASPVRSVSTFRDRRTPNRVRLIAELAQPVTPTVDREGDNVRWHFISRDIAKRPVRTKDVPSPVVGGFGEASPTLVAQSVTPLQPQAGRRRIYHGATIDFDFKDAPIHDLLRVIADTGHVNIVVPDTIDAKVTVRLKRVPWDEALEVILASKGLWYRRDGNLYRIAPRKELDAEDEAEAARREAAVKAEPPRPEVVTLNYASAEDLKTKLEPMLSTKGKIETDGRTNALIVNDVSGNRAEIVRLALSLDTQTPQITIEARIVEARSTFVRQFGVQWGGNAIAGAAGGNATGLLFPSSIAIAGGNQDQATPRAGVSLPSDFAVNLPASTGTGAGGVLGFSLGSIGGNVNINLRLSALEDSGTVRIISAPKVTVLNNKEAMISQGVSIPISVVSAAGTNTQFVQADLALKVTPYVSQRDCAIAMNLVVTKNEADFVNVGARGDPTILRKEARTQMLVSDGDTAVLGGIYTRNTGLAYKKVPFFGDIPLLGWLFKNRRENDDRTEILVFITPKITNKATLPCAR